MKGVLILMSFVLFVLIAGCDLETAHESISPAKAEVSTSLGVTCVNCIIGNRPDILPFYESNGWDIDESNWVAIINNWCSVDPEGCAEEMRKCEGFCSSSQPPPQTTSLPASTVPVELCAVSYVECIIANRTDILPFYQSNGWNIDRSNWPNIIENWCSIDPAGCAEEMRRCESQSATNPPQMTAQPTTPPSPVSYVECIIANRPDILPFYQSNGWNIDRSNWPNIIENWCSIDPAGCAEEMRRCESQSATNPPQSTTPPSAPSFECAACIISNRPDILPFYQSNGWNIDQSNWVNIILDWYRIAPEGFLGEAQRCGSVCGYAHTITADANLALQAVSCAADSAYDSNYDGNKARDANAATKWCSTASTSGHWLKYNLGGIKEVHKIVVRHAGSNGEMQAMNTQTFQLRFGRNDNNWEVSFDVNNSNQSHVTEYNVGSINAQYVMLYITDCGIDNYARIYEFEVWGTDTTVQTVSNLALSASSCTADTAYDSNYGGHKAKDGNTATKWCSTNGSASHWLKYDLGGLKEINRLVVRHAGSNGEMQVMNTEAFELRFGRSDNNWETTCTVSNTGRENITDFNVGSVIARYVMLYITDCGIDNYARIYEFEVWGTAASSNSTPSPTLSSTATPVSTAVSTPDPTATPAPTTVLPPAPASLKGAYWLQYDGGYESYPANVPPVAWNLDYCGMVPDNAAGYRTYYLPRNIKTLARLTLDLTPDEKQSLENLSNPAPQLAQRLAHWNSQVDQVCGALGGDFDNLIYGFIFGNEENLGGESNISGVAYARAYNAFRAQWNGRGKPLLASGPGGCGVGGQCTDFYNGMLSVIGSVDGFAIHAYGYESFKNYSDMGGFIDQINAINRAKGRPPVFITEYNIPLQMTQPQNALQWGKYFNDRYNDVLSFNASNGNQIKALLYFVDAQDHWSSRRYGSNREIVAQAWWDYSLKKGSVTGDGRREAWKNAPFAPQ